MIGISRNILYFVKIECCKVLKKRLTVKFLKFSNFYDFGLFQRASAESNQEKLWNDWKAPNAFKAVPRSFFHG